MMDCDTIIVKGLLVVNTENEAIQYNQPKGDEKPFVDYNLPAEESAERIV